MSELSFLPRRLPLARVAGGFAIAGTIIGTLLFVAACAGFNAALYLSPIPLAMGILAFALSILGGFQHNPAVEDTHVVAAIFTSLAVILGALLLMAIWLDWTIFPAGASM